MLRSMTGYGRCLVENQDVIQQWEIRSVNNRHLDLKWRLPAVARSLEPRLEKLVRKFASRGRVEISLVLRFSRDAAPKPDFDTEQARSMLDSLRALAKENGDSFTPDYNRLLTIPSLWGDMGEDVAEELAQPLLDGLHMALEDWNEGRATEGRALGRDLQSRVLSMEEWTDRISERAPLIRDERTTILRERLSDALDSLGTELEEGRFLQEIAILTDRLDVSEELTRLNTHLSRLRSLLDSGDDAGRRLDFTLQECFREINTCGNKLPDVQLSRLVVDFKNELEKCREQVQNLE